ncbi:hypothetical protein [Pragia fontium]|uniref:hypothetical protein n=1 Tax=Pragia fontium TaxID=82985 RepID=UPI000F6C69A9|nr:hypothetical protein [Pragia fontium]VEJ56597.1 Uncharacterised protein [Pragia fontium]
MPRQFVVIERVNYSDRQDYGLKLLAITDSPKEAEKLTQKLRETYIQNEHYQISFLYLEVDNNLLKKRLENIC